MIVMRECSIAKFNESFMDQSMRMVNGEDLYSFNKDAQITNKIRAQSLRWLGHLVSLEGTIERLSFG